MGMSLNCTWCYVEDTPPKDLAFWLAREVRETHLTPVLCSGDASGYYLPFDLAKTSRQGPVQVRRPVGLCHCPTPWTAIDDSQACLSFLRSEHGPARLATAFEARVAVFTIERGELWRYRCFQERGTVAEVTSRDAGLTSARVISEWFNVPLEIIVPYLAMTSEDDGNRAHVGDTFEVSDAAVLQDLLDKLNLSYLSNNHKKSCRRSCIVPVLVVGQ